MVRYLLSPKLNKADRYFPIGDPEKLTGLDHADWDKVLNHIVVEGLNIIEALQLICRHIGWGFREDYEYDENDGKVKARLVFYKVASASASSRDNDNPTILQTLHAPAVGDSIAEAVAEGKKLLWSMDLDEDITNVVNRPWGLGAPHRFEFSQTRHFRLRERHAPLQRRRRRPSGRSTRSRPATCGRVGCRPSSGRRRSGCTRGRVGGRLR